MKNSIEIDALDRRILQSLQEDASRSHTEIAAETHSSPTSCWRRIKRLTEAGVLRGQVALVNPDAVGLSVRVICTVKLNDHGAEAREKFERFLKDRPEVIQAYMTTGDTDFLLLVLAEDVAAFQRFLTEHLLSQPYVASANSGFALKEVKYTTQLPL